MQLMQHYVRSQLKLSCIKQFLRVHNLINRVQSYVWLLGTCAIPAGMYASHVWATPFLRQGKDMNYHIQIWLLTVLKRIMMVDKVAEPEPACPRAKW